MKKALIILIFALMPLFLSAQESAIPAAGAIVGQSAMSVNSHGNVVSSTICYENNGYGYRDDYVWYLYFDSHQMFRYGDSRARGWAIRPVKDKS